MAARDDQQLIDTISRIAAASGWDVVSTDRGGATIRVTIEHTKTPTEIQRLGPTAPGA